MNGFPWLAVSLAGVLAQGCASAPEPVDPGVPPDRTVLMQSPSEAIVLLPLNVTAVMPEQLEAESPRIWEELQVYLRAHGGKLKTLSYPAARKLWLESIVEARGGPRGSKGGFAAAARVFVGKVSKHAEFASVVVPSLFVQGADVSGRTASWDGVERELTIDEGHWAGGVPEETPFGGVLPAASLHAVVLDAEGNIVQQKQSGIAMLVSIRLRGRPGKGLPEFQIQELTTPFADREGVLAGIAQALSPFLSPLEPSLVLERATEDGA